MTTILRFILPVLFLALPAWTGAGCATDPTKGYTVKDQYRGGIRTITVPIWERGRSVYRRNLEMRLTEALVKRIEQDTPYKVVAEARADTKLTGTIDQVEQQVLNVNTDTGLPRETAITLIVSFTWTDLRTGRELVHKTNFRVTGTYLPGDPVNEDFFQGSEQVINDLAERIVEQLEADW